jgi:ankyrin repeat protein
VILNLQSFVLNVYSRFLLAQLHIESLQDRGKGDTSVKSLRKALDELPKASNRSLDETYTEALLRIRRQKSQDADLAERILVWLSCAVRPLTVLEIRHAMAVMKLDEDENDFNEDALSHRDSLTSVCGGLVVIDETSQNIRLVHYTTQEYLERNPTRVRLDPHDLVANACLSYLCMTPFAAGPCLDDESLESRLAKYALLEYASKYWGVHAQKRSQQHDDTVQSFLYQNNNVASSVQAMFVSDIRMNGYSQDFPRDTAPLWIAASFGLVETIRYCLGFGAEVDFPTDLGETALHRAAEIGHEEAVKLLVAHGASGTRARGRQIPELRIHYHSKPFEYKPKDCSLLTAAESGDMSRVLQFLERGSPEYNDDKGRAALHWAVRHDQEALAQALLANGANPNAMGDSDETLLMEAAHDKVSTRILRLLLDHGADPNIQDPRESHTALHFAIQPGNYEKIAALLEFGALVYLRSIHGDTAIDEAEMRARWAKNEDDDEKWDAILHILKKTRPRHGIGESALHLAAKGAHLGAVTALLDKSSAGDIDAKNWAGETALQVATNMNHLPVVEYLLVHGANVDISNAAGETALHSATVQGNLKVVKSIISRTADLNVCDHNGKSPLMYAGRIGNRGVVVMLLDTNKVDVNATDRTGSTVLMEASSYEHLDVVEKLLTVDTIEVNVKDRLGNSALALAAQGGDEAVVDRLLEADAYKDDRNNNRETPLMKASKSGYPGVVNRLLRAGVNVNANVESGSTARKVFCYHLTEDGHKIDIHFTIRGDTALILAAKYGHVTVVHHLLRADADMNARNGRGETALMLAAEYGHEMTVDLLLRAGSDVNVKGGHDEITALTLAADNKHHTIVDYLLRAGADVNVKLESGHHMGETALILAAEHEHSAVAELIPAIDKVVQTDSDSSETDDDGSET